MLVGLRIKDYLGEIGMSQAHLSRLTKIGLRRLNLLLNGKQKLSYENYQAICSALQVDFEKFLASRSPFL